MELKTERLTLRPVQMGDEEAIHEYAGDKEITMMFWLPNETFEETKNFVKKASEEWKSENPKNYEFVIVHGGVIIGGCGIEYNDDRTHCILGWVLNKKYRRQGFASEAASALLDFGFSNLGIEKIYAQCDSNNAASFGVMKKIGMKCVNDKGTRTYPRTGKTSGEFTCCITKGEWEDLRK